MDSYDLVVIGSGPGGYVAAIKAAKLGMRTAIIESREIGGTCLNRGCIPTKTLMHSSHLYQEAKDLKNLGIHFDEISFDMEQLQNRKDEVVNKIRQGIVSLLEANGVTILLGTAKIASEHRIIFCPHYVNSKIDITIDKKDITIDKKDITIDKKDKTIDKTIDEKIDKTIDETIDEINDKTNDKTNDNNIVKTIDIEANRILIATGSKPAIPKIDGITLPNVVTSDELLSKRSLYQKLLIIGGGVIGIEFASIYSDFGCDVEIIEAMDRVVPNMDKEISQSIAMNLKKKGVVIHTKAKVTGISKGPSGVLICEYEEKGQVKSTTAEGILVSVGRKANVEELFAPEVNIEWDGSCIKVKDNFETSIKGIYAIGDVIKGKQLAHAASAQGIVAVECMCSVQPSINLTVIPSCIYTTPEVAAVGMSEEEATLNGYTVKAGKYPMLGNCKTLLSMGERGFIKVISDATTDRILGAQLLCDRATDIVSEFATSISLGLTTKELASVIRPHPTYSEAITEAVEDVEGMAIHLMPKRL